MVADPFGSRRAAGGMGVHWGTIHMIIKNRRGRREIAFGLLMIVGFAGRPVAAAVIGIDASVSTTVQELIDGEPASESTDTEQLAADSSNLPLFVSGSLLSTDLEGVLASMAQGFSEFRDPARLDQPNPEEFALEVACYSNAASISYTVTSEAGESRTIVFTTEGNPLADPEIDFGIGLTHTVESRVFISGAVIFWSTQTGTALDEMISELRVTVTRDDTNATLFETTIAVAAEGTSEVTPNSTGPILSEVIGLDDLRDQGVDEGTIAILERVEQEGALIVVVIPPQEHTYTYSVRANEPMVLTAALNAQTQNIPGGTGVAAVLGRPFENLADFIEQGLPGVNGEALQRSLNAATKARAIGLVTTASSPSPGCFMGGLCGAFGFESVVALALGLIVMFTRSRR